MKEKRVSETWLFVLMCRNWVREMWFLFKVDLRLKMACKLADMRNKITNKRHWVLPDSRTGGLLVVNKEQIKFQKKKGLTDYQQGSIERNRLMFYRTKDGRYGNDPLPTEERRELASRYRRWQKHLNPIFNKANIGDTIIRAQKKPNRK